MARTYGSMAFSGRAAFSVGGAGRLLLSWLLAVHPHHTARILAGSGRDLDVDGRDALPESRGARTGPSRCFSLLFGDVRGDSEDRRSLDGVGNPLSMVVGRGFFLRSSFQRVSGAGASAQFQLSRSGVAHGRGVWAGGELAEYCAARALGDHFLSVVAWSEIPEPCRSLGSSPLARILATGRTPVPRASRIVPGS